MFYFKTQKLNGQNAHTVRQKSVTTNLRFNII